MRTIDVKSIIETQNLDTKEVAKHLFPGNKYPRLALNRVIAGDAVLDANQISKLALLAGVTISELYGKEWKSKSKKDLMIFESEDYRAELNTVTWVTKIFHNNSMFHESIIHSKAIPLSEYLNELTLIISKYQKDEQNN